MSTVTVVNPYDLNEIGSVALDSWDVVDGYLETAKALHEDKTALLPAYQRMDVLTKAAAIMRERFDDLAFQIADEGGKPLVDARIETDRAIDGMAVAVRELANQKGTQIPMDLTAAGAGRIAFTQPEPIGPVVAVSAFNHPLNLIVHQVAPAVATGCPAIVKPAGDTPLSAKSFVEILYEAGLPEEWVRFTMCENDVTEKLVTDPRTAFFSFIGSARVGWMLRSKLAPGTRCALEHGGAAPVIVGPDADLDAMIPSLLKGGFYHSGQVCVSVQRVFAPRSMASDIAERLARGAGKLTVGNAIEEDTDCGPLIRPGEVDRVSSWVDEAISAGAKKVTGAEKLSETTYAPTVLLDPPADTKLSTLEVFGPVICVYSYDDADAAIAQANALPYSFQSAVFAKDISFAMKCVRDLEASAVMVNDHTAFRVDWMPFAGRRQSGYGVGGIGYTMHDMVEEKMAVIKL